MLAACLLDDEEKRRGPGVTPENWQLSDLQRQVNKRGTSSSSTALFLKGALASRKLFK
jgi:hypothetical protein